MFRQQPKNKKPILSLYILNFIHYISFMIGMTSVPANYSVQDDKKKLQRAYKIVVQIIGILLCLLILWIAVDEQVNFSKVLKIVHYLKLAFKIFTVFSNYVVDDRETILRTIKKTIQMSVKCAKFRASMDFDKTIAKLLCFKLAILISIIIIDLTSPLLENKQYASRFWIVWISETYITFLIFSLTIIFCAATLFTSKFCCVLYEELKRIFNILQQIQRSRGNRGRYLLCQLSDEIDDIAQYFNEVHQLAKHVNRRFELMTVVILNATYFNNIAYAFYMYIEFQDPHTNSVTLFIFMSLLLINFTALYLDFYIAQMTTDKFLRSRILLEDFLIAEGLMFDERFAQSIESLYLQLIVEDFKVHVCGLFILDKKLVSAIAISSVANILLLIQFTLQENLN